MARRNTYNVTLKDQDQIWPQVKVGQGHEVTQVGYIIYQSTRLNETNALTSTPRLYISPFDRKLLAKKASDLEWPHLTFRGVRDQKFRFKYE